MIVWYLKQIGNGFLMCDAGTETGACAVVLLEVLVVMVKYVLNLTFHWIQVQWMAYNMRPINIDQLTQSLQRSRRRRFHGRSRRRCRLDRVPA